jgi:AbiTii-like protein
MDSLVIQLQRECLDPNVSTVDITRKALVVARKLDVADFHKWVSKEIEGYQPGDEVPEYRMVHGQIKAWNPYHGWIDVVMENPKVKEVLSVRAIGQPIGELDTIVKSSGGSTIQVSFPPQTELELMRGSSVHLKSALHVSGAAVKGISDRVRDIVLNWCLDLEAKGVLGEGMTFSEKEKKSASEANYHVHYHGNVGTSQIQQGTVDSSQTISTQIDLGGVKSLVAELRSQIPELKLAADRESQMLAELASIEAQLSAPQPRRGVIAECLSSVRNILEGCAGSLIASGLLQQVATVCSK